MIFAEWNNEHNAAFGLYTHTHTHTAYCLLPAIIRYSSQILYKVTQAKQGPVRLVH